MCMLFLTARVLASSKKLSALAKVCQKSIKYNYDGRGKLVRQSFVHFTESKKFYRNNINYIKL